MAGQSSSRAAASHALRRCAFLVAARCACCMELHRVRCIVCVRCMLQLVLRTVHVCSMLHDMRICCTLVLHVAACQALVSAAQWNSPCCMLHAVRCVLHAVRCMLHAACCTLHVACCTLHVACCTLRAVRCMLHVVRYMVYVACCALHAVRYMVYVARCMLSFACSAHRTLYKAWCQLCSTQHTACNVHVNILLSFFFCILRWDVAR